MGNNERNAYSRTETIAARTKKKKTKNKTLGGHEE